MHKRVFLYNAGKGDESFIQGLLHRRQNHNVSLLNYCRTITESLYAEGRIRSWKKYRMLYGKLERFLSNYAGSRTHDIPLRKVNRTFIQDFDTYLRASSLHPNSVNVNMAVLQTIVNRALGKICSMAGIDKHVTMHVSRHSFANLAREKGVMSTEIKDLLAHSNLKTTELYMGEFDRQRSDDILHNLFE